MSKAVRITLTAFVLLNHRCVPIDPIAKINLNTTSVFFIVHLPEKYGRRP